MGTGGGIVGQAEDLKDLLRFLPTDQEIAMLQSYAGSRRELAQPEQFLLEINSITRLKQRLHTFAFASECHTKVPAPFRMLSNPYCRPSGDLSAACVAA